MTAAAAALGIAADFFFNIMPPLAILDLIIGTAY